MAQTTGWLASALANFDIMPILAGVKEAKMRSAVFPGDELEFEGHVIHEGSGFTVAEVKGRRQGKGVCDAKDHLSHAALPEPAIPPGDPRLGRAPAVPVQGAGEVSARREVWITGVGLLTCLGEGMEANWSASNAAIRRPTTTKPSRPTSCIRSGDEL